MGRAAWGKALIAIAAASSIVIPIGVDGVLLAKAHMANPLWLPHAKLHCAMSFFAAIGLGVSALLILKDHSATNGPAMRNAAFCATIFWAGLIAAGFWPGASYNFAGDPANYIPPPVLLGIAVDLNVVAAAVSILIGWSGYLLTRNAWKSQDGKQGRAQA